MQQGSAISHMLLRLWRGQWIVSTADSEPVGYDSGEFWFAIVVNDIAVIELVANSPWAARETRSTTNTSASAPSPVETFEEPGTVDAITHMHCS